MKHNKWYTGIIALIFFLSFIHSDANTLTLTPTGGYFFNETFPVVNGSVLVKGGGFYGGIISYQTSQDIDVELQVNSRVSSIISTTDSVRELSLRTTWALVDACYTFDLDAPASPFINIGMGLVHLQPEKGNFNAENRFALNIGAGIKYEITDRIGIRLSTQFMSTMNQSTSFENQNGDALYTVNKMAYVNQFGFRGGIYFKIIQ